MRVAFGKARGLHGSPRLHADLLDDGCTADPALGLGINTLGGAITCPGVADAFPDLATTDLADALS